MGRPFPFSRDLNRDRDNNTAYFNRASHKRDNSHPGFPPRISPLAGLQAFTRKTPPGRLWRLIHQPFQQLQQTAPLKADPPAPPLSGRFNLDIHTSRQRELIQSINRLPRWLHNINHSLVSSHLELLARLLIHMRTSQDSVSLNSSWQRNGTMNDRTGPLRCVDNF